MPRLIFVTHPEVVADPATDLRRWRLSSAGRRRMQAFAACAEVAGVGAVWASAETKAIEAAEILAAARGLAVRLDSDLGENDRSATGYLPPAEFERTADAFFARPMDSIRGWERAIDAQGRVLAAITRILATHRDGDLAVVAHGGVGTLLLCALTGAAIGRGLDQPFQGHFWVADLPELRVRHLWRPIAPREGQPSAATLRNGP